MSWFRVDDTLHSHDKFAELDASHGWQLAALATSIWVRAGADCAHRREGTISWSRVARLTLAPVDEVESATHALIEVGLWAARNEGKQTFFDFVNWDRYNGDEGAKKAADAERQQRARERKKTSLCDNVTAGRDARHTEPLRTVTQSRVTRHAPAPHPTPIHPNTPQGSVMRTHAREEVSERPKTETRFAADELAAAIDAELREQGAGSFGQMLPGNVAHHASTVLAFFRRESEMQGRPPDELVRESVGDYLASDYVKTRKSKTISMKQWFEDPGRNTPWNRKKELQKQLTPRQDQAVWRLENGAMLYDDDADILKEMGLL